MGDERGKRPMDIVGIYEGVAEPMMLDFGIRTLDALGLAAGERLLDVGARAGGLAVEAARRGCRVVATGEAPPMVARATERLADFADAEATRMAPGALEFADGSFDAALSLFGVISERTWRPELAEMARVTRRGGRLAVGMFTEGRDASPEALMRRVFEAVFPGRELRPADLFPDWSVDSLTVVLREAGCEDVRVDVWHSTWAPLGGSGRPLTASEVMDAADPMFREFQGYRDLADDERERLRAPFAEALARFAGADGSVRMPVAAYVGIGRRS